MSSDRAGRGGSRRDFLKGVGVAGAGLSQRRIARLGRPPRNADSAVPRGNHPPPS
ncbi:MAG: twin-arginine translocation signal domain-containing protein [Solirubrobacteraceae bacterium]